MAMDEVLVVGSGVGIAAPCEAVQTGILVCQFEVAMGT